MPGSCEARDIGVEVDASSFLLTGLDGRLILSPLKSLWIDCYANAGAWIDNPHHGLDPPFVNDVADLKILANLNGLTDMTGCGGGWQAPLQATDQARVWAVIRDDRGGIGWLEKRFFVH